MKEKNYTLHKIAESIEELNFSPNAMTEVTIDGKTICVVLQKDKLLACAQNCPHAGGKMAAGFLDAAGNIVCPLHHYKFNPQTGRNISGEGYFLKTFPIEIRKEGIFAGFEKNNLFNWLK
jgi:3-phenylpropionate/trans-cinnamate dioxygenase ferredoxin subunit